MVPSNAQQRSDEKAVLAGKVAAFSAQLAQAEQAYGVPANYVDTMGDFFTSYMTEIHQSGRDIAYFESLLFTLFYKVLELVKEPHRFDPFHAAMRSPFDFDRLGTEFFSGLVQREASAIHGLEVVRQIQEQLAMGDNVVLLANHQSEADPQILSVLLNPCAPGFASEIIYVSGDRVTTDLLAQPFAMGRNMLCIFSKRHIESPPEHKVHAGAAARSQDVAETCPHPFPYDRRSLMR